MAADDTCEVVVVTCIDFRFQRMLDRWLQNNVGHGHYDRVGLSGGSLNKEKVFEEIQTSKTLHDVQRVILINHEDCGAYKGKGGSKTQHIQDLRDMQKLITDTFKDVEVETYYARLDGSLESV